MKRTLTGIAAASMVLAAAAQVMEPPKARKVQPRQWTCRKCGSKFHPQMSPTLCDDCIRRRDAKQVSTPIPWSSRQMVIDGLCDGDLALVDADVYPGVPGLEPPRRCWTIGDLYVEGDDIEHCDVCGRPLDQMRGEDFFVEDADGSHVYCEAHWPDRGETA
ncbi:hypothetical protein [Alicyclobacillus sp. ALC3]|uniref:hypothetical protein n=1 Tax=Alicyclobacillus sp. ALC3 TaxID=2796143 RepID=UPI0023793566|nr:hypothetical protein [Alicyclobacillus sp. ALC3]WDL97822.1 hypothetical protein JC200_03565 [Alicyclobacillus sp. ALC3]